MKRITLTTILAGLALWLPAQDYLTKRWLGTTMGDVWTEAVTNRVYIRMSNRPNELMGKVSLLYWQTNKYVIYSWEGRYNTNIFESIEGPIIGIAEETADIPSVVVPFTNYWNPKWIIVTNQGGANYCVSNNISPYPLTGIYTNKQGPPLPKGLK